MQCKSVIIFVLRATWKCLLKGKHKAKNFDIFSIKKCLRCIDFSRSIKFHSERNYERFIHACWILSVLFTGMLEYFEMGKSLSPNQNYKITYQTCTYSLNLMCLIHPRIIFGNLMYRARIQIDFFPQLLEL